MGEQEPEQLVSFIKSEIENLSEKKYEFISKDIGALRHELYKNFATKEDDCKSGIQIDSLGFYILGNAVSECIYISKISCKIIHH